VITCAFAVTLSLVPLCAQPVLVLIGSDAINTVVLIERSRNMKHNSRLKVSQSDKHIVYPHRAFLFSISQPSAIQPFILTGAYHSHKLLNNGLDLNDIIYLQSVTGPPECAFRSYTPIQLFGRRNVRCDKAFVRSLVNFVTLRPVMAAQGTGILRVASRRFSSF
jgi:hypothetical protein